MSPCCYIDFMYHIYCYFCEPFRSGSLFETYLILTQAASAAALRHYITTNGRPGPAARAGGRGGGSTLAREAGSGSSPVPALWVWGGLGLGWAGPAGSVEVGGAPGGAAGKEGYADFLSEIIFMQYIVVYR